MRLLVALGVQRTTASAHPPRLVVQKIGHPSASQQQTQQTPPGKPAPSATETVPIALVRTERRLTNAQNSVKARWSDAHVTSALDTFGASAYHVAWFDALCIAPSRRRISPRCHAMPRCAVADLCFHTRPHAAPHDSRSRTLAAPCCVCTARPKVTQYCPP
jgi:hypothetical protein